MCAAYLRLEVVSNDRDVVQEGIGQNLPGLISLGSKTALALKGRGLALDLGAYTGTCSSLHPRTVEGLPHSLLNVRPLMQSTVGGEDQQHMPGRFIQLGAWAEDWQSPVPCEVLEN